MEKEENNTDSDIQDNDQEGASPEEEIEKSVARLQTKLDVAYGKQDDLKSKYLRAVADLENIRKRSIREREEATQRTRTQVIGDLLPTLDAFQLGFAEAKKHEDASNFVEGFSMAVSLMETTLSEYGLAVIDPQGGSFDAKCHEAIGYEEKPGCEEGTVISTTRIGYRIGEQLLRPASVILAKTSSSSEEE
jgi:molecular chaperone GrpE